MKRTTLHIADLYATPFGEQRDVRACVAAVTLRNTAHATPSTDEDKTGKP